MAYRDYSLKAKKRIKETTLGRTKIRSVRLVFAGLYIVLPKVKKWVSETTLARTKNGSLRIIS